MVRDINAFAAEDGTVFATHRQAARHEAETKLKRLGVFNHGSVLAILDNAPAICDALNSLLDEPLENPHA